MRKFTLFLAALCCTITANAKEIVVDGIHYDLNQEYRQASVVSNESDQGNYANIHGHITIPATIQHNSTTYHVRNIANAAFCDCKTITSVTIEEGIYTIGAGAFRSCSLLESVTLPESVNTMGWAVFRNNPQLTSITLPMGLQVVPSEMCSYCTALRTIKLPDNLVSIDICAFLDCAALSSIVIPDKTAIICKSAFKGCTSLKSVDIPASMALIEEQAFEGCSNLEIIKCRVSPLLDVNPNVFQDVDCRNVGLIVPNQSVNAYGAHSVWGQFTVKRLNYDISFEVNGSVVYTVPKEYHTPASDIKAEAKLVEQQMSVPAGKVFKHWNPEIKWVTKDQVYEAVLEPDGTITKCTIQFGVNGVPKTSFQLNEGSPESDVEYLADIFLDQVDVPADLEFKYWEPALAAVTDNQTYNAVFDYIDQNYYTISFVIEGETIFSVDLKYGTEDWVVEGYANAVANNAVYPEGMTFKDWDKYFNKVTESETYTARLRPIGEGIEEVQREPSGQYKSTKVIKDGQLLIERSGKTYNALGAEVK